MILVDTNVIVDVVSNDPAWAQKAAIALDRAAATDRPVINDVIYSELSIKYDRVEDLERMLDTAGIDLMQIPRQALFIAGKAYQKYRKLTGTKTGVLPDFFIGAHAAVANLPLLTRDARRIRTYFPSVVVIEP